MPGGTITLDPVIIGGDDREDERRAAARAALERMLPAGSLDGIQVADPRPESQRTADLPALPPLDPEPPPPPALQRQAAEAQQVGDRYRASLRPDAAPQRPASSPSSAAPLPMGPLARPGESAAIMSQATGTPPPAALAAPQRPAPTVDRARLLQALETRRGQPPGAPVPATRLISPADVAGRDPMMVGADPARRAEAMRSPMVMNDPAERARRRALDPIDTIGAPPAGLSAPRRESALAPGMDRIAALRAPHPDAEVYGTATDDDPELPGNIRPGGADPNAEIWGMASDSDPELPGALGPGLAPGAMPSNPPGPRGAAMPLGNPAAIEPGNVDMRKRPSVPNPAGGRSSVLSMSIGTDRGEVLIPTVSDDGRIMSEDEAIRQHERTGRHLGIYATPEAATAAADELHRSEARRGDDPPMRPPPGAIDRADLARLLSARQASRSLPPVSPASAGATPPPDFTGADWHDAIRRPFHAVGNALSAAAGRPTTPFRSERAQIEARMARDAATDATRQRAEREAGLAERRLALAERQAADATALGRERNAISRDMQSGRLDVSRDRVDLATRVAQLRESGMGEQEALARARREELQFELGTRQAMRDPASPESQSARASLMAELDTLRDEIGFDPPEGVRQMLEAASGEQAQRYRETLIRSGVLRPRTARRGGPGGGGGSAFGGVPRDQWGTDADPIYRDALASGVPESTARALASDREERTRLARSMAGGAMTGARGEGRAEEADTRALGRDLDAGARVQSATSHAREVIEGATDAELRAAFMGGEMGSLMPARVQQIRSVINEMQASVLMERSGASVAEQEFDRTRREMGTVPTQSTSVIREWVRLQDNRNRDLRARIRARYGDDVVREYDSRLEREGIAPERHPNAPARRSETPAADMVQVIAPDGRRGRIPRSRLEAARAAGYREAD